MTLHISTLMRHPPTSPTNKISMTLRIENNKVHPSSLLHTCFIYKNGDAILDTGGISWQNRDVCLDFYMDKSHCDISNINMVLISPSLGEWSVPNVVLTDDTGNTSEFVATNLDGNCMYVVPEPPSDEKIQDGLRTYSDMKQRILKLHASLVGTSAFLVHFMNPTDDVYTKWFALGGIVGLAYQYLIQYEIDQVGHKHKSIVYPLLANSFFRLTMISSVFLLTTAQPATQAMDISVFATILAGFMMNKVAMYITFATQKNESSLLKD